MILFDVEYWQAFATNYSFVAKEGGDWFFTQNKVTFQMPGPQALDKK